MRSLCCALPMIAILKVLVCSWMMEIVVEKKKLNLPALEVGAIAAATMSTSIKGEISSVAKSIWCVNAQIHRS